MKLTPWYPGYTTPVRKGVYAVKLYGLREDGYYRYWDGKCWGFTASSVESAYSIRKSIAWYGDLPCVWRGLAERAA